MHRARVLLTATVAGVLLGVAAPAPATAGLKAFWGPSEMAGRSQFPVYDRLGVDLYQTLLRWDAVAPTRPANPRDPQDPAYRWPSELDTVMSEADRYRIRVLLMVIGSPAWANGGRSQEWAPSPRDYANFVTAAARRYGRVRHWMIWGEPSRAANFKPLVAQTVGRPLTTAQRAAPRRYARILDAAYGALKRVRRSNLVIGGNTFSGGDIRPLPWVRNLRLPNGRPPRMDLYGHNPFSLREPSLGNPPGAAETIDFSDLPRLQRAVNRYLARGRRKRIRLFLSEWTVPTGPDREFNFYVTPRTQSAFLRAGFRVARAVDAYALGWIHLYDEPANADGSPHSNGGLLYADGREKPGFRAFRRGRL